MSTMPRVAATLVLGLIASACTADELAKPPATTAAVVTTAAPTTTLAPTASATTISLPTKTIPSYQVVERVAGTEGDVLIVLLEEGTYDDLDIENLMLHLVDEFAPFGIHVVNNEAAVELVLAEDMELDDPVLAEHYLARLENGNKVVFAGPLAGEGWFLVGS